MAALSLKFLGDLEVLRGSERLALPPSRKTRALLAYLALNRRAFHRQHLCELFWDIPDDPRGSLRWSLSKLRHLVDDDAKTRIVADRNTVSFDTADVSIDVASLVAAAAEADDCPLAALEAAAERYQGHLFEGLDLTDFHDFDAWCQGQRESATAAQVRILSALTRRLADEPERALPHARALVGIAPYDEAARASLIRLLVMLDRREQAEQQYKVGVRLLAEVRKTSSGELREALHATTSAPAPRTAQPTRSLDPSPPDVATPAASAPAGSRRPAQAAAPSLSEPAHAEASAEARSTSPLETFGLRPSSPGEVPAPPLLGRDTELEQIRLALRRGAERARGSVMLLRGEPGIGKSRLLDAAAAEAQAAGALLLRACAYESESIRPFALWIDALARLGGAAAEDVFDERTGDRERLFGSLSGFVAARAREQPVVLVFDDVQWADDSSAAALHYVARLNREARFFALLAAREDELRDNTAVQRALRGLRQAGLLEEVRLGPLNEGALRALIASQAPEADGERLSKACGGNPLLAIELTRAEAAGDSGRSLGELVRDRLARLDIDGGEVLRWAAVLAPSIDAATLARVTGFDWNHICELLETAARQALLHATEQGFRFSHDLVARSIYAEISPARRRTMHRRVAELLERDTALDLARAADLAHHASQSGDARLSARAMVSAGRLCLRFFANEEALSLARKGLAWAEQLPDRERVCVTLELRDIMLGAAPVEDSEAAAKEYAALAEQALDHGELAHARRGYYMASYVHWVKGHWAGARQEILQSERVARGGGDDEHIVGMADAARCLAQLERDLPHADAMLMEAQALASRRRVRHYSIEAALGMLRLHENDLDEAAERFSEARALAKSSGDRLNEFQAQEYLAMVEFQRGAFAAAEAHCAALLELGEKLREGSELPFARAFAALCSYALGGDGAALEPALDGLRAADAKQRLAYTLTRAALLDLERQRVELAVTRAREALGYARALDRATEIALAYIILARASQATDDAEGCAQHLAMLADLEQGSVARWARERAAALRDPGSRAVASPRGRAEL